MGKNFPLPSPSTRSRADLRGGSFLASNRDGHTLVELAIALAIIGLLAGMGWSAIQPQLDRYRMLKAARMMHADIQHLRTLAIATSRETRIKLVAADALLDPSDTQVGEWLLQVGNRSSGSNEWDTLPIDLNGEGDNSQGERSISYEGTDELHNISLATWPTLVGPGTDNADCVVFTPRGWVGNPSTDFADGYVDLTFVNKGSLRRGGDERAVIRISRGGLARIEASDAQALPANPVGTAEASGT